MKRVLYAFCDLSLTAASFDFVTFLVRAMKERDECGCTDLHVVFVPNEKDPAAGFLRKWGKHDDAAAYWRFWHICVASLPLARATMTMAPTRQFAQEMKDDIIGSSWWPVGKAHFMRPLVEAARRGEAIPRLRATDAAHRYVEGWFGGTKKPIVTVTVRRQETDADRNSNGNAVGKFVDFLGEQGMAVVLLDDSNVELQRSSGDFAALDPDLRLALYERARMNIIGNNGPQELLKFSAAPYMAFGQAPTPAWGDHWRKHFGMEPGEQLPWARLNQRLVYKPDTLENLKAEWLRWAYDSQR